MIFRTGLLWALKLSWRKDKTVLLRSLLLVALAALLTAAVAAAVAINQSSSLADERGTERAVLTVGSIRNGDFETFQASPNDRDTESDIAFYTWNWSIADGRLLPLVVTEGSESIEAFGGIDLSRSGWHISEGLRTFVNDDAAYSAIFGDATLIDADALRSPSEVFAIHVLPVGLRLEHGLAAAIDPGGTTTLGNEHVTGNRIETASMLVVVVLCIVALRSVLALASTARFSRERVLSQIGASRHQTYALRVVAAIVTMLPGILIGLAAWQAFGRRLTTRPVDGQEVFAGDLVLSPTALAGVGALMISVIVIASLFEREATYRPAQNDVRPSANRLFWFGPCAVAVVLAARLGASYQRDLLFAAALVLFVAALWANIPLAVSTVGRWVGELGQRQVPFLLAGRRLERNALDTARAVGAIAVFAMLTPLIGAWYDASITSNTDDDSAVSAYDLGPPGLPGDYDDFANAAGLSLDPIPIVVVIQTEPDSNGAVQQPVALAPGSCEQWASQSEFARCENGSVLRGAARIPINFVGDQLSIDEAAAQATNYLVRYDEPDQRVAVHKATTILNLERVSQRALGIVDGDALYPPTFASVSEYRDPINQRNTAWLTTVMISVIGTGVLVALLFVALQSRRTGTDRSRLGAIGATRTHIRKIAFLETLIAVLSVSLLGIAAALAVLINLRVFNADVPQPNMQLVAYEAFVLTAIAVASATVAAAAVRDPSRLWADQNSSIQ